MISGWPAVLLAPLVAPIALLAQLLPGKKTIDRTPEEVVGFIEDFLEGTGGDWDWDEFESVPITDPTLEAIRIRATTPGVELSDLLQEARQIASARSA
ncbi:hypothetical protein [Phenylobacterium sp.]|uniref:hypothetical protein n=1 Tax=Phenylobacterium sp. TaxID=1871053 RepID=UPI0035B1F7F0